MCNLISQTLDFLTPNNLNQKSFPLDIVHHNFTPDISLSSQFLRPILVLGGFHCICYVYICWLNVNSRAPNATQIHIKKLDCITELNVYSVNECKSFAPI